MKTFKMRELLSLISGAALAISCAGSALASNSGGATTSAATPMGDVGPSQTAPNLTAQLGGTGAPPATLGGFTMTKIPMPPGTHACTGNPPPIPTGSGGSVGVTPADTRCIGAGWATWSHGYQGDVYFTGGATSQTISLPSGTGAVYFYVEPNPFTTHNCQATANGSGGSATTGSFSVTGDAGARYVGFHEPSGTISSVKVSCDVDFATGEYGWAAAGGGGCPLLKLAETDEPGLLEQIDLFYQVRDQVLPEELVDAYYANGPEVVKLLVADSGLRKQARLLLRALTPTLQAAVDGNGMNLSAAQKRAVKGFAENLQRNASDDLADDLQAFIDDYL